MQWFLLLKHIFIAFARCIVGQYFYLFMKFAYNFTLPSCEDRFINTINTIFIMRCFNTFTGNLHDAGFNPFLRELLLFCLYLLYLGHMVILMMCHFHRVLNKKSYLYSRVWITSHLYLCNSKFHARTIFRHSRFYIIFLLPKSKKRKHKISINNTRY